MAMLEIHPRIFLRHPQLNEEDIRTAWRNSYYEALRADSQNYPEYLWIGVDSKGRDVEMVGWMAHLSCEYAAFAKSAARG